MRIIITGSRDMAANAVGIDIVTVAIRREAGPGPHVIVHGAARGADMCAEWAAVINEWQSEPHPADWKRFGKKAGPIRNQNMADRGADLCIAFPDSNSVGTLDMVRRAKAAGIRTLVYGL